MNITPIPDREAASKLGVAYSTIRNAVDRGDLVRFPMKGQLQHVVEEQLMLFEGMSRIVREKLSPEKLRKWHEINDSVMHSYPAQQSPQTEHINATPVTIGSFNFPTKETAEFMYQNNLAMDMAQTPSGGMSFPYVQSDEADSKVEFNVTVWQAVAILAGLIALFFVLNNALQQARVQAEQELQKTGLEKDDLVEDRKKSIIMLQTHPKSARRMQKIVEDAFISEAV